MTPLATPRLDDAKAEQVRQTHAAAIAEQQNKPASSLTPLGDVSLPNGTTTLVPHSLGRVPTFVWVSPVKTAGVTPGVIIDVSTTTSGLDRTKQVALQASGFGATVRVTVAVM